MNTPKDFLPSGPPGSLYPACWAAAIRFAAGEVDKLAAHFVGNIKTDDTRDSTVYEQGIGCERAGQMLREVASLIERQREQPNIPDQQPGELPKTL